MKPLMKNSLILLSSLLAVFSLNCQAEEQNENLPFSVTNASRYDKSKPFHELLALKKIKDKAKQDKENLARPSFSYQNIFDVKKGESNNYNKPKDFNSIKSKVFQGNTPMPETLISVDGIAKLDTIAFASDNLLPPDTNGDVGLQYYVQYVNTFWAVFEKENGSRVSDIHEGNTFWTGFGGICESDNAGDPVVLFDKLAQVWVFTQFGEFSSADANDGGFQCFAISDRADLMDPNVTFYRYEYQFLNSINDYPHLTIWNDESGARSGYYMTTHDFTIPLATAVFQQASFSVFERDAMLTGQAARFLRFTDTDYFGNEAFGALSAHLESTELPPAGMCAPFINNDREGGANAGYYVLWQLCVDWNNINQSSLTAPVKINTSLMPFDYEGVVDIPQPAPAPVGAELDNHVGKTLYRASARAYPSGTGRDVEIAINHTLHAGDGVSGIIWAHLSLPTNFAPSDIIFENGFDVTNNPNIDIPHIIDEGFYSPDDDSRWMGTISLDQAGNIGLAYSVSGTNTFPSVRYTGRESSDPLGQFRVEGSCAIGEGVQTYIDGDGRAGRWGDYSSMSIDPIDQCTFWTSVEYVTVDGISNWENRICSFRFENCGDPDFQLKSNTPSTINICTNDADPVIDLKLLSFSGFNSTTNLTSTGLTNGATLNFANTSFNTFPASTTATISNLLAAGINNFDLVVNATSITPAINKSKTFNLDISLGNAVAVTLQTPSNTSIEQSVKPILTWGLLANAETYTLEIATDITFNNIVSTATTTDNSYKVDIKLNNTTQYFWRVKTANHCGEGATSATFSFTTGTPGSCPSGTSDNIVFNDDVENSIANWTITHSTGSANDLIPYSDDDWEQSTTMANSGTSSFFAIVPEVAGEVTRSDMKLVSPPITLPDSSQFPVTLSYWNFQALANTESRCDAAGILEISTDNGVTFTKIKNANLLTDEYNIQTYHIASVTPFPSELSWCASATAPEYGPQETVSVVNLNEYAGQTVKFRFRLGSTFSVLLEDGGWWIDDIKVKGCQ